MGLNLEGDGEHKNHRNLLVNKFTVEHVCDKKDNRDPSLTSCTAEEFVDKNNCPLEKYIPSLRNVVKKTKCLISEQLKKAEKRCKEDIAKCDSMEKTMFLKKKMDKISNNLTLLNNLAEDDVTKFALSTQHQLMAAAVNPRLHPLVRLKAQVASHKPLSTHLLRIKEKLNKTTESDEGSDKGTNENVASTCINNHIIQLRKGVKRAKVHVIHKLTKHIKKFRLCKGRNKEKLARKADRLVEKIKLIKVLDEDTVSKFALTCNKDLTKLSTDIKSPMEKQVMAMIALNTFMADSLAAFKNRYPDWQKDLPKFLMKQKKKRKLISETTENKKEHLKAVDSQLNVNKFENRNETSNIVEDQNAEEEKDQSEQSSNESEMSENVSIKSETDENQKANSEEGRKNKRNNIGKHGKIENNSDIKETKKTNTLTGTKKPCVSPTLNLDADKVDTNKYSYRPNTLEEVKTGTPIIVDPFFVTLANEDYVTSQVPNLESSKNTFISKQYDQFQSYKRNRSMTVDLNKHRNFNKIRDNPYEKPFGDHFDNSNNVRRSPGPNIFAVGNRKERRKALKQSIQTDTVEKLHPSWEAKKKVPSIASFQGKKITFD